MSTSRELPIIPSLAGMQVVGVGLLVHRVADNRRMVVLFPMTAVYFPSLVLSRGPNRFAARSIKAVQVVPKERLQVFLFVLCSDDDDFVLRVAQEHLMLKFTEIASFPPELLSRFEIQRDEIGVVLQ